MKIAFLISHVPDPRMLKRITVAEQDNPVKVIYWNRMLENYISKITFDPKSNVEYEEVQIRVEQGKIFKRIPKFFLFITKVIQVLRKYKPEIIHAGNLDMLIVANTYKKLFDKNVKLIYEVADLHKIVYGNHQSRKLKMANTLFQFIEKRATKRISKIILTSPHFWKKYYATFIPEKKYLFIANAPEKRYFTNYIPKTLDEGITLGHVGLITYPEQMKMMIDVIQRVEKVDGFIAGDGAIYEDIKQYIEGKEKITLYGPYQYTSEISQLYSRVNLVYSVYDTKLDNVKIALPNRLYEAIVCELPIIASKNTFLGEYVTQHNIGFAVDDTDAKELEELLVLLTHNPEIILNIKKNMRKIKEDYYMESYSDKLRKVYNGEL